MARGDPYVGRELLAGQFKVLERIGAGATGSVYKAHEPSMDRLVAVKILHAKYTSRKDLASRFRREARAMSNLTHPNTVRVYLYGQLEDGACYIVMEHLDGRNLGQLVRQDGAMPAARAIAVIVQACGSLEEAHQNWIVHRDVKPENIFLCKQGGLDDFVKVLDFGMAKVSEREMAPGSLIYTQEGMMIGTPEFVSPEQARCQSLDPRSDVYSLAVTLYELVTAKLPFEGCSPMDHVRAHIMDSPIPPSERAPEYGFPPEFDGVILKALSKNPDDRFQSATEFAEALAALVPDAAGSPGDGTIGAPAGRGAASTVVSAPPLTALGDARLGEIHPTNARAHGRLRTSARMAVDSEAEANAAAAEAKRRSSALEAIHAIEHTLRRRLERAREDAVTVTRLRGAIPSTGKNRLPFAQSKLRDALDRKVPPSLYALAQLAATADGAPELAALARTVLGVPEQITSELLGVGALRIILAHETEYELGEKAALDEAEGWVERVAVDDATAIRVLPGTLDRLAWVAACLLERRVRPREEFGL